MRRSIKHLPKRTQEEINILLELILKTITNVEMVHLFGSYARGNYVIYDKRVEYGTRTFYQSDLDILVVIRKGSQKIMEDTVRNKVEPMYHERLAYRTHPMPRIIIEYLDDLNKQLDLSHYFYSEIIKTGIRIYDTNKYTLAKSRPLTFAEIKTKAENEYVTYFPDGEEFLNVGWFCYERGTSKIGSFQLHQSCERLLYAISLVFTDYKPKTHNLKELIARVREFLPESPKLFPIETEFEKRCYDLLCRAYIEARYNRDFGVTKEELEYMLENAKKLKEVTQSICTVQLNDYEQKSKEEHRLRRNF